MRPANDENDIVEYVISKVSPRTGPKDSSLGTLWMCYGCDANNGVAIMTMAVPSPEEALQQVLSTANSCLLQSDPTRRAKLTKTSEGERVVQCDHIPIRKED